MRALPICAISLLSLTTKAQLLYLNDTLAINNHAEKVSQLFFESKIEEAFDVLNRHWPMPEEELSNLIEMTTSQMDIVKTRFGKAITFQKMSNKKVSNFLIRKVYVVQYEKHIIRLLFIYYKNEKGWQVNSFKWDDKIEELFEN